MDEQKITEIIEMWASKTSPRAKRGLTRELLALIAEDRAGLEENLRDYFSLYLSEYTRRVDVITLISSYFKGEAK